MHQHAPAWWQHAGEALAAECGRALRGEVPLAALEQRRRRRREYQALYAAKHARTQGFQVGMCGDAGASSLPPTALHRTTSMVGDTVLPARAAHLRSVCMPALRVSLEHHHSLREPLRSRHDGVAALPAAGAGFAVVAAAARAPRRPG